VAALSTGNSGKVRGRAGRARLITRLAIELFLLAVMITAACAWTAIALVDDTFRRQVRDDLRGLIDGGEVAVDRQRDQVVESVDNLVAYLQSEPGLLERFLLGQRDLRYEGVRLMNMFQLTFLEIRDDEGGVLTSGHDPERIGLPGLDLGEIPVDRSVLRRARLPEEAATMIFDRSDLQIATRTLVVVGGRELDRPFVEQVAGHDAAVLIEVGEADDFETTASSNGESLPPGDLRQKLREPGNTPTRVTVGGGDSWLIDFRQLEDDDPEAELWLVVAVNLSRMEELRRQLTEAFLLLGVGVGLIAAVAGVFIARRTARPVRDLIAAFDAIASGEADYSFRTRAHDEMQELVNSFSHLHRALDDQRRRAMATERVAAWREVARHVAHEVKNPLAPIRLTVENLLRVRSQAPEKFDLMFEEGMQTILEEVQQLSRMVSEFAEFARLPLPTHRPEDLESLIDRVVELYASEPGVTISKRIKPGMPSVELDADQVSRALKNVLGNAIDATRDAHHGEGSSPKVEIRAAINDGMAQIVVADNGPGFSQEAERRLFEPYFTTKEHGTGLGMALTYRIIIEHGGVIFAENSPEGGAQVIVRLPLEAPPTHVTHDREEAYG
jgi:signal transduction histidine kinase